MEGLHLLADVAVADFEDCGDSPKKKKQGPRFRERNCCALDQDASKFIHLNMLVDVAAAAASTSFFFLMHGTSTLPLLLRRTRIP